MYRWRSFRFKGRRMSTYLQLLSMLVFIFTFKYMLSPTTPTKAEKREAEIKVKEERLELHKMRTDIDVWKWNENTTIGCDGNFKGFGEEFVRLKFVRINPITKTFYIPCGCDNIPEYYFQYGREGTPLTDWRNNMLTYIPSLKPQLELIDTTTVAINRIEAHNLYHTMCEWYNVFLLSMLQGFDPSNINILFMDDRPPGHMDEAWGVLFKTTMKYSLGFNNAFTDLFWNIIGYESPMNHHYIHQLPFVDEFKDFFLRSFDITENKTLYCARLTVTIFLRRDYMTHPERLKMTGGLVHRKFKNEDDIINNVHDVFKGPIVNVVVLERMSIKQQLEIVTNTDVLIGMHGAGMSHMLFLPQHAVIFEMFPKYWGFYHHFKAMARWRNLKYFGWQNMDSNNEFPDFYTHIPEEVIRSHYKAIKQHLCGS